MKLESLEVQFKPIQITLESLEEARALMFILGSFSIDNFDEVSKELKGRSKSIVNFGDNMFIKLANEGINPY